MYRLSLVAAPVGIWYAVKNVERVAVRGGEYDRYAITFDEWEQATVERAFEVAKGRQPSQLIASAFYRSPAFALERVGLGVFFWAYDSNHDLFHRSWDVGQQVSGSFEVVFRDEHRTQLRLGAFTTEVRLDAKRVEMATYVDGSLVDVDAMSFRAASVVHQLYSRLLLAGAKFKLLDDCERQILCERH